VLPVEVLVLEVLELEWERERGLELEWEQGVGLVPELVCCRLAQY
jgi:hypothetical protein